MIGDVLIRQPLGNQFKDALLPVTDGLCQGRLLFHVRESVQRANGLDKRRIRQLWPGFLEQFLQLSPELSEGAYVVFPP